MEQVYHLQSRWKVEGRSLYYYGLRNKENLFRNRVRLSARQTEIIAALPKALTQTEKNALGDLLGEQIVPVEALRSVPTSLADAKFCTTCCANDFIIPGLEFDTDGRCPLCQTADAVRGLRSLVPIVEDIPPAKDSRFDAALFYTGGKDSTYLLYYLSKVKKLRILALTWEIPFMSDSARKSIENAKKCFDNVEFISHCVNRNALKRFYSKLYDLSENTCACPSLAYLLFYPTLVENRVPYFLAGNEPAQILGLYYNHIAPRIAYSFPENKALTFLYNVGRVLTLQPPLKQGQIQTLMTMKQLAYGNNAVQKASGYTNELVTHIVEAIHALPELLPPLKRSIRRSSWTGHVPAFVHFDFDTIAGGTYDWNQVKDILRRECGWVSPADDQKALHTSCAIEKCKDHSQFLRFYHCRSKMIPFSSLEISLASRNCGRSREETLYEMEHLLGCTLDAPAECAIMREFIGDTK